MRLLNVLTLEIDQFSGTHIPPYAIASHRWRVDEASFEDVSKRLNRYSRGFQKLESFCAFVLDHPPSPSLRLEWLWIDSCG